MHQIDNAWAVTAKPVANPVGTPGWFQKGAPPNLLATIVDFDWANTVQAEILNVVLGAGLTPDKTNDSQLLLAIQQMLQNATGVNLNMFVLKAGDTMTGPLITPKLTSNTGRIISQNAGANPSVVAYDNTLAAGFWSSHATGIVFGSTDARGTPLAAWFAANGSSLTSLFALTATTNVTALGGRIISRGTSYPSVAVYDTAKGVAWGMWSDPSGNLAWGPADGNGGASTQLMWLTNAGQIVATSMALSGALSAGTITGTSIHSTGQLMAGGAIYASYPTAPAFYLNGDGTQNVLNFQGGYAFIWNTSAGLLSYMANSAVAMTIDYQGNMGLTGNLGISQSVTFNGSGPGSAAGPGAIFCTPNSGVFRFMGAYPQYQQLGIKSWGDILSYNTQNHPDGGGAWSCDINGQTQQGGACFATSYPGPSDASLKTNEAPFTPGLAAVLQINPISYEFTEDSQLSTAGTKHYGVTAQEVQAVLPEAVVTMQRQLSNDPADPPSQVLAVEANTIFFACVNAIKELAARLDALEAVPA